MNARWAWEAWRFRLVYFGLMPAIAVAAAVLGYYSWISATQFARLGEETIAQSTLLIVSEKVDQVEQAIIGADNAVLGLVDPNEPEEIERAWLRVADAVSPTVVSVVLLDDSGNVEAYVHRGSEAQSRSFRKVFMEQIIPDLELERQRVGRLKHLQGTYEGKSYLLSYKAITRGGRRYYAIVSHDTSLIVAQQFPTLFASEDGKRLYNVVDENNRRVYGVSLANAGDYLVGRRFPTTLYNWRLQVAPKQAPLLESQAEVRSINEAGLVALALTVILLGVVFLFYAAAKERRVGALKADFIANVSHELKTPLSVIRMYAELLLTRRVKTEEKRTEYLETICAESERLSALIENVLDFAAVERGKRVYTVARRDLVDVVKRAIDAFRYRIEHQGGDVELAVHKAPPELAIDEQAMFLAITNLLDNAVKYGGGTAVRVEIESTESRVTIRVCDRGPGIPKEDLKRVFERFYRSRKNSSPPGPGLPAPRGSGIGLSLVKRVAEAHGGRAYAENGPEGGAIVSIELPLPARERVDRAEEETSAITA
jgi:two-component system phosphate regulon sensor histidine kinase PhoR